MTGPIRSKPNRIRQIVIEAFGKVDRPVEPAGD